MSDLTGISIAVISKATSYRNFQKEVGCSPSRYREIVRNMDRVPERDGE